MLISEEEYCPICYTNVINGFNSEEAVTFDECGHKFCRECCLEQFKQLIEKAEIDKVRCLDYECLRPVSEKQLEQILTVCDKLELMEKYRRFKASKNLDLDPLVRFCPKPDCGQHMRGEEGAQKLQCPKCSTWICFKCRDEWHGDDVTCEEAMNKQLAGWAEENKDNVSFCPMCRTKIEKNLGCNHMTCGFCKYEFCWSCGASATNAERHFDSGRGCGVKKMDDRVKPGDHLKITKTSKCKEQSWKIGKIVLVVIFFPIVLVFYMPYTQTKKSL